MNTELNQALTDVIIIGGGPAGLSAAANCVARGISCRIIATNRPLIAKAESINNHLGFINVSGEELMSGFEKHIESLGLQIEKGKISNIMNFDGKFMLNLNGEIIESKAVIMAVGQSKSKPFAGEDEFLGRGVSYCATCDGMLFRGKNAVVVDLSSEAFEEANFLHSIGVITTFVSAKARPSELNPEISYINARVKEIEGSGTVSSVKLEDVASKEIQSLNTNVVFILRDSIAPNTLMPEIELENGYIKVSRNMETNIPGLFAAGDCTGWPIQVSNAVGEGLIAAQQAAKYITNLNKEKTI